MAVSPAGRIRLPGGLRGRTAMDENGQWIAAARSPGGVPLFCTGGTEHAAASALRGLIGILDEVTGPPGNPGSAPEWNDVVRAARNAWNGATGEEDAREMLQACGLLPPGKRGPRPGYSYGRQGGDR